MPVPKSIFGVAGKLAIDDVVNTHYVGQQLCMTDMNCAKAVLNPCIKRSKYYRLVICSAVFVIRLQNLNERRDMYSCQTQRHAKAYKSEKRARDVSFYQSKF